MSKKITDLTPASAAQLTDLHEIVHNPAAAGEASQSTTLQQQADATRQSLSTTDANPNTAAIVPPDLSRPADFYQDTLGAPNRWSWSVTHQTWVQYMVPN